MHGYLSGAETVTVRLRFHPLSHGKAVLVRAARGIILNPPGELLSVPTDGQCLVSISLDPETTQSHVSFTCEGLTTTLVVARTTPEIVAAKEEAQ
jgi:hypothetical protein